MIFCNKTRDYHKGITYYIIWCLHLILLLFSLILKVLKTLYSLEHRLVRRFQLGNFLMVNWGTVLLNMRLKLALLLDLINLKLLVAHVRTLHISFWHNVIVIFSRIFFGLLVLYRNPFLARLLNSIANWLLQVLI